MKRTELLDLLRLPDGRAMRLKVRSLVGLLPLLRRRSLPGDAAARYPKLMEMIALFRKRHPEVVAQVAPTDEGYIGYKGRRLLSILNKRKLERVLAYMLDENEFLGPHGIRSLSRYHLDHPFTFDVGGQDYKVQTCRQNRIPGCSAATPIGAARSGCPSMPW